MFYIVGDIGNTSTKICVLNKKLQILQKKHKMFYKNLADISHIKSLVRNRRFQTSCPSHKTHPLAFTYLPVSLNKLR